MRNMCVNQSANQFIKLCFTTVDANYVIINCSWNYTRNAGFRVHSMSCVHRFYLHNIQYQRQYYAN